MYVCLNGREYPLIGQALRWKKTGDISVALCEVEGEYLLITGSEWVKCGLLEPLAPGEHRIVVGDDNND